MIIKSNDIKKFEKLNSVDLPHDTPSETALIGTILMTPEFILKTDYILPSMFYNRELGCIFNIIKDLFVKGIENIDTFIVVNEINGNKGYKAIFDDLENIKDISDYLEDMQLVARNTIEEYNLLCGKIITASFKRDSYIKLKMLGDEIVNSKEDINNINCKLQNDISDFSKVYVVNQDIMTIGEQADVIWQGILNKRSGNGLFGFPSKFNELNKYTTLQKQELVVYAGKSKSGKSQILSNELWDSVAFGIPGAYIDREMSTENHFIRMLSYFTGIDSSKIKSGSTNNAEDLMIREKMKYIKTLPFTHIYMPTVNDDELYLTTKSLKLKKGIEMLGYDYLKSNGISSENETMILGAQTDICKNLLAGSLNLAVLSSCQLDDKSERTAGSQKIERNCSTLITLIRKTKEEIVADGGMNAGNMKMRVKANRNGQMHEEDEYINLMVDGNVSRVTQAKIPFTTGGNVPY